MQQNVARDLTFQIVANTLYDMLWKTCLSSVNKRFEYVYFNRPITNKAKVCHVLFPLFSHDCQNDERIYANWQTNKFLSLSFFRIEANRSRNYRCYRIIVLLNICWRCYVNNCANAHAVMLTVKRILPVSLLHTCKPKGFALICDP